MITRPKRSVRFLVLWALIAAAGCTDAPGETSAAAPEPEGAEADSVRLPPPAAEAVIQAMASLPTEGLWPGFAPPTDPDSRRSGDPAPS